MKPIILTMCMLLCLGANAQRYSDNTNLNIDVSQYEIVHIYNTGGETSVKVSSGNNLRLDATRKIKAKSDRKLEEAKADIFLDTSVVDGALIIYVENPYRVLKGDYDNDHFYYTSRHNGGHYGNGWGNNGVDFTFDMDITLPPTTTLIVSTHRGDLEVDGVRGALRAVNHHGNVSLNDVKVLHYAHSHHGDVEVSFVSQPDNDMSFDTHHGDIRVSFPQAPSAEIEFDSHHGSFYTDFDWNPSKAQLEVNKSKRRRGTKYKIGDRTKVSMGQGNHKMTFDTHHGDMYILKN